MQSHGDVKVEGGGGMEVSANKARKLGEVRSQKALGVC